jgi:beta-mannosidase
MKKIFLIFYIVIISTPLFSQTLRFDLNNNWVFRKVGDTTWYPSRVPGTVHTDLLANKIIPDPYFGDNEKKLQWIENEDWEYKTEFYDTNGVISFAIRDHKNVDMIFEGLDTYADVYLNNALILRADNMFRTWTVNIKPYLINGKNTLHIIFRSPVKIIDSLKKNQISLPGDYYSRIRKSAYHFGWDWAPKFSTFGIWKKIFLSVWNDFKIDNVKIVQNYLSKERADLTAVLTVTSFKTSSVNTSLVCRKMFVDDIMSGIDIHIVGADNLILGKNFIKINFSLENPKLWWCNGLGKQYLYFINTALTDNKNNYEYITTSVGLRKIELVQNKDTLGESFYFKLNGVPVFMKGANYIPLDVFLPFKKILDYYKIIRVAKKSNVNMLRVWGGGVYENDEFYNLCDANGILVWQDFMFACAMYPGDSSFVNNVRLEAIENIQRLNNHPCIALWCGNNEIDEGWHNWGWQKQFGYSQEDSAKIWNDYLKIFHDVLPSVVNEYAVVKNYIPSSPKIGWGHPESMTEGDSHYWGVWWGMEPFDVYKTKVPRFMSEYGFQAFPDMKTIESFTQPEDRYLYSDVMKSHQKHPTGYETIQTYLEREYKQPKDFESYVYVSQLLQAYGVSTAIEAQRRAKPFCMGTLYWQFNDCWPVVSWSGIDYYGRWKALQYFVKKEYRAILVSINEEDETIKLYVVSDRLTDTKGLLKLKLMDFSGKIITEFTKDILVLSNSSKIYYEIDLDEILPLIKKNETLLSVDFESSDGEVYNSIHYFALNKDLVLQKPNISINSEKNSSGHIITLVSDNLAKNVFLSISDEDIQFSDNYFDMLPGKIYTIQINKNISLQKLKIKSLFDTY